MTGPETPVGAAIDGAIFDATFQLQVERARDNAVNELLRARDPGGAWTGELSASALSTATAVTALTLAGRTDAVAAERLGPYIRRGYAWLLEHQNADGGWGDTTRSRSNISTTALVWAALNLRADSDFAPVGSIAAAERWLTAAAGSLHPERLVAAIEARYGKDRT